jgi:hypothetical protein
MDLRDERLWARRHADGRRDGHPHEGSGRYPSAPTAGRGAMVAPCAVRLPAPAWEEATPPRPCPVCGAADGCAVDAADPDLVLCRRRDSALPVVGGSWLHVLPPAKADGLRGSRIGPGRAWSWPGR